MYFIRSNAQSYIDFKSLSIDQLVEIEDSLQETNDWIKLQFVLDEHIKKAKSLKDTIELISTYDWKMQFSTAELAEAYADSALFLAKMSKNNAARSHLYYSFGSLFYSKNLPVEALENVIQGYFVNHTSKNYSGIIECLNLIASIKREYGQEHEALHIQKASYRILEEKATKIENYEETLLYTLESLSKCYLSVNALDLALSTALKGKSLAFDLGNHDMVISFETTIGQSHFYKGDLKKANAILSNLNNKTEGESRADILYYLGQIQLNDNRAASTIRYYRKIDSILFSKGYPLIDNAEDIYQTLLENSISKEDNVLKEHYLSQLVYYDSLKSITDYKIEKIALMEFDLKTDLSQDQIKKTQIFPIILISSLLCLIAYLFFLKRSTTSVKDKIKSCSKSEVNKLPDEVRLGILRKLKRWELNEGYLYPNTTQVELAEQLGTNSTYLSKIINQELGMSYSKYIRELRTKYMISDFEKNYHELGKKSMIQLAERYGFKSQYAFINTFKLSTGITPAVYLRKKKYYT